MPTYTPVSNNFRLLRFKYGDHESLCKKLVSATNSKELSDFSSAANEPSESMKREIEGLLKLPIGWLDRDNLSLTELIESDYLLVNSIVKLRESVKLAFANLIIAIRET